MVGDFNCPLNPSIDKRGGLLNPRKAVISTIGILIEELELVDKRKVKNPDKKSFTRNQNSLIIFYRLDYWLISNALHDLQQILKYLYMSLQQITLLFPLNLLTRSMMLKVQVWKIKCSLLDDEEYVNVIAESIPIW